jgi:hypothetical protein
MNAITSLVIMSSYLTEIIYFFKDMASFIFSLTYLLVSAAVSANRIALKTTEKMYMLKQAFVHFRVVYNQM